MPGYKGHLTGGAVISGAVLAWLVWAGIYVPSTHQMVVMGCLALLGALFPDVDTDSRGQHLFYLMLVVLDVILLWSGQYKWAAIIGFAAMFPALGPHRGWTHTWWAMLIIPLPICILPVYFYGTDPKNMLPYYGAAVTGYASHLLLDGKWR